MPSSNKKDRSSLNILALATCPTKRDNKSKKLATKYYAAKKSDEIDERLHEWVHIALHKMHNTVYFMKKNWERFDMVHGYNDFYHAYRMDDGRIFVQAKPSDIHQTYLVSGEEIDEEIAKMCEKKNQWNDKAHALHMKYAKLYYTVDILNAENDLPLFVTPHWTLDFVHYSFVAVYH